MYTTRPSALCPAHHPAPREGLRSPLAEAAAPGTERTAPLENRANGVVASARLSNGAAADLDEFEADFIATASHDLKSPLTALLGYTQGGDIPLQPAVLTQQCRAVMLGSSQRRTQAKPA